MNRDSIAGALYGGIIGDAYGSLFEGKPIANKIDLSEVSYPQCSDDSQLTLATCEALPCPLKALAQAVASQLLKWFRHGRISGIGSSTLKALRDLDVGASCFLSGATGERSAGNGAAMRIGPLAFLDFAPDAEVFTLVRDVTFITHRNDEAYIGARAVFDTLRSIQSGLPLNASLERLPGSLPDTRTRDQIEVMLDLAEVGIVEGSRILGTSGHVCESVPFALFAASKIERIGFRAMLEEIIQSGGDTDTNAFIACQIAGAHTGLANLPKELVEKVCRLEDAFVIIEAFIDRLEKSQPNCANALD